MFAAQGKSLRLQAVPWLYGGDNVGAFEFERKKFLQR
jgi:hypothetical protein